MGTVSAIYQKFKSQLSLQPLVDVLKKMIAEEKPGAKKLYQGLINELEAKPELLLPMETAVPLEKEGELVETLLSTIFPPATSSNQGIYAVAFPFRTETIYASPAFREIFLKPGSNAIAFNDVKTNFDVANATLCLAYDLILKKFYNHPVPITTSSVHPLKDENGLTKFYEMKLNAQFANVKCIDEKFSLPENF